MKFLARNKKLLFSGDISEQERNKYVYLFEKKNNMKLTFDAKFMFVSEKDFFLFSHKSLLKDSSNHFCACLTPITET